MERHIDHYWAVDEIDGDVARIIEDGARLILAPTYLLPPGVAEGQMLSVTREEEESGSVRISIALDAQATQSARLGTASVLARALAAARKADPGGDVGH
jgi:hypothetical protein